MSASRCEYLSPLANPARTVAIVLGHALAVVIAHLIAVTDTPDRRAVLSQLPLAAVMVFYTLFGFWLPSTPVVG